MYQQQQGQQQQMPPQQQAQQQMPQGQPQQQAQQQQMPMQSDEQVLDQMLANETCGPMAEADIELEPAQMDVGMAELGPEDEVLRTLFAQDDEQGGEQEQQQKQAGAPMARTASSRTVGTRPTAGVAKLGGTVAQGGSSNLSVDNLSSLWQSAPDVRDAFGIR
jgi:hypothetical protein